MATCLLTHLERSIALALWAGAGFDLVALALDIRAEDVAALVAVKFDDGQLWQDAGGRGDDATGPDQLVQVQLPEKMQSREG